MTTTSSPYSGSLLKLALTTVGILAFFAAALSIVDLRGAPPRGDSESTAGLATSSRH